MGAFADLTDEGFSAKQAALGVRLNADASPEKAAEALQLARRYSIPPAVAEQFAEDYRARAKTEDALETFKRAPKLGSWIAEQPERQKVAADDIDTLGGIEAAIRTIKAVPSAVASAFPRAGAGLYGAAAAPFEVAGQGFRMAEDALADLMGAPRGMGRNVGEAVGGFLRNEQRAAQAVAQGIYTPPADAGVIERGVGSGLQSATQTLLTLPIAMREGGQNVALGILGLIEGGASYGKGREVLAPSQAAVFGIENAVAEVVTERLPFAKLLGDIKAGTSGAKMLVNNLVREVPGELAATLWQNFNEWANLNPEKSVVQWLGEQPEALAETVVATLVGGGAQVGAIKTVQAGMDRLSGKARQAEQDATQMKALAKLAEASKLRSRDAETFREYVEQVADERGDEPGEFYIDGQVLANTLNQSGVTMQELEAVAPVVARQLEEAATGGDIRIPVSEFLTAGEAITAPLIDHLRTAPEAMSRAEARDYIATESERMSADLERAMQDRVDRDEFRASVEAVRQEFQAELDGVKRFTSDVNNAYAELLANFYGATAARLGMKPQELLQRYRLRVQSRMATGDRNLTQGDVLDLGDIESLMSTPDMAGVQDNASGESAASLEAQSRVADEKAKGRRRVVLDVTNGQVTPLVGVDAVDTAAGPGKIVLQRGIGNADWTVLSVGDGVTRNAAMAAVGRGQAQGALNQSTQTETDAFKKWFGSSKVVDENGKPRIVYHGTAADFAEFSPEFMYAGEGASQSGSGFYFTTNPDSASRYATLKGDEGGRVMPVYLSLQNPLRIDFRAGETQGADITLTPAQVRKIILSIPNIRSTEDSPLMNFGDIAFDGLEKVLREAVRSYAGGNNIAALRNDFFDRDHGAWLRAFSKATGYDSAYSVTDSGDVHYVAWFPEQVKSAVGNRGTFDPNDPSILNQDETPRAQISLPTDITASPSVISLLEGADLSSFIHESGHFFLEVQADLAIKIQQQIDSGASVSEGERAIVGDMNRLLEWFGVKGAQPVGGDVGGVLEQAGRGVTDTPEFKRWFGDSKAVDAQGKPLVVYHGTGKDFGYVFNTQGGTGKTADTGAFFSSSTAAANSYASGEARNVMPVYIALKTPLVVDAGGANWNRIGQKARVEMPEITAAPATAQEDENLLAELEGREPETVKPIKRKAKKTNVRELFKGEWDYPDDTASTDDIARWARKQGYDGVIFRNVKDRGPSGAFDHEAAQVPADLFVAFRPEQIKSAIGNRGTFDPADASILNQGGSEGEASAPAPLGRTPLETWAMMSLDEKRQYHEQFARGFEAFAFEGKAPSLQLQGVFQRFRSWLMQVYKTLRGLNVELTDDVRAVMGRMIATDFAIEEAEAQRAMGPLFKSADDAGMTLEEFNKYQALAGKATENAVDQLQTRSLADMKWMGRARDRALKERQKEVEALRRDVRQEVRSEVLREPVYRAWQFLTTKGDEGETAVGEKRSKSAGVDRNADNLFTAIAKLGGLRRDELASQWGIDPADMKAMQSGVFGKPVARKEGGLSLDAMMEALVEDGYILPDENGKADLADFEAKFDAQRRGEEQFSVWRDFGGPTVVALGEDKVAGKLNTTMLREQYGTGEQAIWRKLSARRMTSDVGIDPEVVAETFGFDSGDALVKALADAVPPSEVIEARTDQRMLEMFGDITSPEALARAADEAVHNEARARFIAAELKALQDANTVRAETGRTRQGRRLTTDVLAAAAKDYAAQIIGRQRVRDLRPGQYAAAEVRSAKLAEKAFAAGKLEEAAMHKRNQLVNHYAAKAAYDAQAEVKKQTDYFRKFEKRPASVDPGYLDQIEAMLERFDFRPVSLREVDRRKSLQAWYDEQVEMGTVPAISDELLDEANRKSYKDMTLEELRGLRDAVRNIEHLGRLKNKLLLARDKRTFDAIADQIAQTVRDNGGKPREVALEGEKGIKPFFDGLAAMHRKLSSYFRQMDGGRDDGPLYEYIGRSMNERGAWEDTQIEQATVRLQALYKPLTKMRGGITGARSKLFIPEINASLTRGGRLAVALNWGNADNRQRIMDGDKWSEAQVRAILKTLTKEELDFVNGVWEFLDSYWPEIAAKEKRVTGVEPEKVKAEPFVVMSADGVEVSMRGGYYPLKYDTDRSDRADTQEAAQVAKEMMRGAMTRATTRRGHTKERVQEVKRAVRKDLNVVTQHVTQVVHDLAWHEWLIDTNRLLRDDRVVDAIREHYGPKVLKTIRDNISGIATADVTPQTEVDKALMVLRANVSRATMGASITTAFLQPFGLTQSMVRIGAKHVLRGGARWAGDAARMENTLEWIRGKSEFMRLRSKSFNRELREINQTVANRSAAMRAVDGGLFWLMQKMQLVADVPTWIGQYEKTIAEYGAIDETDAAAVAAREAAAVAQADRAVIEAQGSGQIKDLAEVQRKHPMLTQFYSYFSVTLNLVAEKTATTDFKNPRAVAGWLGDMALLLVIPAIMPALLLDLARGGGEDDEPEDLAKKMAKWQLAYLMGLAVGVREGSGMLEGFDYAGPPVGRVVSDIGKAGKQTAQGEVDEAAVLAYARLIGTAFGIPITQVLRSYKGWKAWDEGEEGAGPQSVLIGPPPKQ